MPTRPANLAGRAPTPRGTSAHARGYGTAHQARAHQVYGQPCIDCGAPADTGDHPDPISNGGDTDQDLEPRCRSCNSRRNHA